MQLIKLDDNYSVVCETKGTRSGFKHEAVLLCNGYERQKTKVCYLNRTWERFTYETVLLKLIEAFFDNEEQKHYKDIIKNMG